MQPIAYLGATSPFLEGKMIRVSGHYLYDIGTQMHPLSEIKAGMPLEEALLPILIAEGALAPLLQQSIYQLRTSQQSGVELLEVIRDIRNKIEADKEQDATLDPYDAYTLQTAFQKFEAVLAAELQLSPLYLVSPKGAYDIDCLAMKGSDVFPEALGQKVPNAIPDIEQACKCLAFELNTACGFHLHRANESVLRQYYDAVTSGADRPKSRNIGDYLNELNKLNKGDAKVKSALKDLKDLYRNPLIHPEYSIESTDEAIALLGSIHAVVTHMLKEIPNPKSLKRSKQKGKNNVTSLPKRKNN